jgi:hypothetical protein
MPSNRPSCNQQKPFVELSTTQNPPRLDYNLPQTTSFVVNTYFPMGYAAEVFKKIFATAPVNSYYTAAAAATEQQMAAGIYSNYTGLVADDEATLNPVKFNVLPDLSLANALVRPGKNLPVEPVEAAARVLPADDEIIGGGGGGGDVGAYVNPKQDIKDLTGIKILGRPIKDIVEKAKFAMPVTYVNFAGQNVIKFVPEPRAATPDITIVEHYRVNTYLGNYGAGEVVKTFSLLPGEKTTLSLKTYKSLVTTRKNVQNVLDSFTDESARDLETLAEQENENKNSTDYADVKSRQVGGGLNLSFGLKKIGGALNVSASRSRTTSFNSHREENIRALNRAISKQAQKSVSQRKVEVNTENTAIETTGEENITVRTLENVNKSRVLNFVFRQMTQELVTVTYLDDVSFVFSNGYEEVKKVAKLADLYDLLTEVVEPAKVDEVYQTLINSLYNVEDHTGAVVSYVEDVAETHKDAFSTPVGNTLYTKRRFRKNGTLTQTVPGSDISVKGVIKNITRRVMPSDSVVVDALLGHGEALDCFNIKVQDAEAERRYAEIDQLQAQLAKQTAENNLLLFKGNLLKEMAEGKLQATIERLLSEGKTDVAAALLQQLMDVNGRQANIDLQLKAGKEE